MENSAGGSSRRSRRVRKRTSNACVRCRQQKIKCSGTIPCGQCVKRSINCSFEAPQHKILVSQSYIDRLERRAGLRAQESDDEGGPSPNGGESPSQRFLAPRPGATRDSSLNGTDDEERSNSEVIGQDQVRTTAEPGLTNPLDPRNASESWTVNAAKRRYFLGVTSNWSFGRRVLNIIHEAVNDTALETADLLFEGSTYDLGWNGQRSSTPVDLSILPTSDFALFMINAVKFHCCRLFHLFHEETFMARFYDFYDSPEDPRHREGLWFSHFLLILAFGKAFVVHGNNGRAPRGAEFFVQAMQHMPDITFLMHYPVHAIEALCCAALYLQCLDLRSSAYNVIGQALRIAVEQGMHIDMSSRHLSKAEVHRCREAWWTVYILDRHMTSLIGVPLSLADDDVTTPLPEFPGSLEKVVALNIHVQLAKAQAVILQTVYGKKAASSDRFLSSMKEALHIVAQTTDDRNSYFPLGGSRPGIGICRLSAYLHIFHHQALILATRPLLFSFLQKRLQSGKSLRVSSSRGARSLLRVCVSSARRCLSILEELQSQSLLECFIPFDLEATFSSAVVLAVASAVDPSLVRDKDPGVNIAYAIMKEMKSRGNLVAEFQERELQQLDRDIRKLQEFAPNNDTNSQMISPSQAEQYAPATTESGNMVPQLDLDTTDGSFAEWNSEDGLNAEQLLAMANCLDVDVLSWPTMGEFDSFMTTL